jgi:hypothetical protein
MLKQLAAAAQPAGGAGAAGANAGAQVMRALRGSACESDAHAHALLFLAGWSGGEDNGHAGAAGAAEDRGAAVQGPSAAHPGKLAWTVSFRGAQRNMRARQQIEEKVYIQEDWKRPYTKLDDVSVAARRKAADAS